MYDLNEDNDPELQYEKLVNRKLSIVNENIFLVLDDYIASLEQVDANKLANSLGKGLLSSGVVGMATRKYFAQTAKAKVVEGSAKALSHAAAASGALKAGLLTAGVTLAANLALDYYFDTSNADELGRARRLLDLINNCLLNESIITLEKLYLQHRPSLKEDFRTAIEKELLKARKNPVMNDGPKAEEMVKDLIALNGKTKVLPPQNERFASANLYKEQKLLFLNNLFGQQQEEENFERLSLNSDFYRDETKAKFKTFIGGVCDDSFLATREGGQNQSFKRAIIFYGKPGTGKSVAAKLIAENLGLPYHHLDIASPQDLENGSLYGQPSNGFTLGKKGLLVEALLAKVDGNTAKNTVIILDDIDRAFVGANGVNMAGIEKFLLKILDKNCHKIQSRFFNVELDFSQVILIATMNHDIRGDNNFKALKSRCDFIDFGSLDIEVIKYDLINALNEDYLELSLAFGEMPEQWPQIKEEIASYVIKNGLIDDYRELERRVLELSSISKENWNEASKLWKQEEA